MPKNRPHYVTMKDNFMSGWGYAKGKSNILIFVCDSYDEAQRLVAYACTRAEMRYISYRGTRKPYYSPSRYYVQVKTRAEYPRWYELNEA